MKLYNNHNSDVPREAVYIGRPGPFGNPFFIGRDGDRETVVAKFRQHLFNRPDLIERVQKELKGKDLACWCTPEACHGDILLKCAAGEPW